MLVKEERHVLFIISRSPIDISKIERRDDFTDLVSKTVEIVHFKDTFSLQDTVPEYLDGQEDKISASGQTISECIVRWLEQLFSHKWYTSISRSRRKK